MEDLCRSCSCNDGGMCVCMTSCPKEKEFEKRRKQREKERRHELMYNDKGMCENCLKADVCKLQEEKKKIRYEILHLSNEHEFLVQIGCKYFAKR